MAQVIRDMRISRTVTALAIIGAVVAGVTGLFLASTASASSTASTAIAAEPGYGYGSKSPTPSRTRSKSPSATPSPSGTLPETGQAAGSLAKTGLIAVATGFVLILGAAIWQARAR